jgi:hypothetical protein
MVCIEQDSLPAGFRKVSTLTILIKEEKFDGIILSDVTQFVNLQFIFEKTAWK